mmetsp:Transcript_52103/g.153727  ORF Transcript_52103/g.153727 Transcript_52103/m.153727 type:complete len:220 (+) Transcript_52103:576-1235(+)
MFLLLVLVLVLLLLDLPVLRLVRHPADHVSGLAELRLRRAAYHHGARVASVGELGRVCAVLAHREERADDGGACAAIGVAAALEDLAELLVHRAEALPDLVVLRQAPVLDRAADLLGEGRRSPARRGAAAVPVEEPEVRGLLAAADSVRVLKTLPQALRLGHRVLDRDAAAPVHPDVRPLLVTLPLRTGHLHRFRMRPGASRSTYRGKTFAGEIATIPC